MSSIFFGYPVPSQYVRQRYTHSIDVGYLIVDAVEKGEMLSETWSSMLHDQIRRASLFTGLSKIMISLARVPFSRIGSLPINDFGVISLTNRP